MKKTVLMALLTMGLTGCALLVHTISGTNDLEDWSYHPSRGLKPRTSSTPLAVYQPYNDGSMQDSNLVQKIFLRDGTNVLGLYMGMIAEWDGCTSRYHPPTNYLGGLRFADNGWMETNSIPQGVMMYSATSGELLKWISAEDFTNIFVLKIKTEYPK